MRLWSIHPRYLDTMGLVALWREGLLAQAVLTGRTRGYRHHPQLERFLGAPAPERRIAGYLRVVHAEAARRGHRFDAAKVGRVGALAPLPVTRGQLDYEWAHLARKLAKRAPAWLSGLAGVRRPRPHPSFRVVPGAVAGWERVPSPRGS
jgi:Pyrimidine dimer DNA glycosylase